MRSGQQTALITGGSRGIGFAIAEAYVRHGYNVMIAARNDKELQEARIQLATIAVGEVRAMTCEVADPVACNRLVQQTVACFGDIDVLVNAAGVQGTIGEFTNLDLTEWKQAFEILFYGPLHLMYAVIPKMKERRRGKVINLSGGGAVAPRPNFSSYASAKAALLRLTETIAAEVEPYGIQVNAIAPGAIYTRMTEQVIAMRESAGVQEYQKAIQIKKLGGASLQDVQELALFLASDASDDVNGQLISAVHHDWWRKRREGTDK